MSGQSTVSRYVSLFTCADLLCWVLYLSQYNIVCSLNLHSSFSHLDSPSYVANCQRNDDTRRARPLFDWQSVLERCDPCHRFTWRLHPLWQCILLRVLRERKLVLDLPIMAKLKSLQIMYNWVSCFFAWSDT